MRRHDRDDRRERDDRHRSDSRDSRRERGDRERRGSEWESTPSRRQAPLNACAHGGSKPHWALSKPPKNITGNFYGAARSFSGMVLLEWCPQAGASRCLCPWMPASACSMRPQLQQHRAGNACWPQRASGPSGCLAGLLHEPCSRSIHGMVNQPQGLPGQCQPSNKAESAGTGRHDGDSEWDSTPRRHEREWERTPSRDGGIPRGRMHTGGSAWEASPSPALTPIRAGSAAGMTGAAAVLSKESARV